MTLLLLIGIIVGIIIGAGYWVNKQLSTRKFIGNLSSSNFAQGDSFNKEVFSSLVVALQNKANKAWSSFLVPPFLALAFILQFVVGGFIGNGLSIVLFFLLAILLRVLIGKPIKQIKSARKELGITKKDINTAISQLRKEYKLSEEYKQAHAHGKSSLFYAALALSFLFYVFVLFAILVVEPPKVYDINTTIVLSLVIAGCLSGFAGVILCLGLKLKGILFAILAFVLPLIGASIPGGEYAAEAPASFNFISMLFMLSAIPFINKSVKAERRPPVWISKAWKIASVFAGILVLFSLFTHLSDAGSFNPSSSNTYTYVRSDGKDITDADFKAFEKVFKSRINDYKKENKTSFAYKMMKGDNEISITIKERFFSEEHLAQMLSMGDFSVHDDNDNIIINRTDVTGITTDWYVRRRIGFFLPKASFERFKEITKDYTGNLYTYYDGVLINTQPFEPSALRATENGSPGNLVMEYQYIISFVDSREKTNHEYTRFVHPIKYPLPFDVVSKNGYRLDLSKWFEIDGSSVKIENGLAQSNTEAKQTIAPKSAKSNPDFNGLPVKLTIKEKDYIFHDLKVEKIKEVVVGDSIDRIYITAYTKSDVSYSLGKKDLRSDDFPIVCIYLTGSGQQWSFDVELKRTDVPDETAIVFGSFVFKDKVGDIIFFEKGQTTNQRRVGYNGEYK